VIEGVALKARELGSEYEKKLGEKYLTSNVSLDLDSILDNVIQEIKQGRLDQDKKQLGQERAEDTNYKSNEVINSSALSKESDDIPSSASRDFLESNHRKESFLDSVHHGEQKNLSIDNVKKNNSNSAAKQEKQTTNKIVFCNDCGAEIRKNWKFCKSCGIKISNF